MQSKIELKAAQPRCYTTGSTNIKAVCHHCGRPMSYRPGAASRFLNRFTANREFDRLPLPVKEQVAAHCDEDSHDSPRFQRILLLPALIIFAIAMAYLATLVPQEITCARNLVRAPITVAAGPAEVLRDPTYANLNPDACYPIQHTRLLTKIGLVGFGLLASIFIGVRSVQLDRSTLRDERSGWVPPLPVFVSADIGQVTEEITVDVEQTNFGLKVTSPASLNGQINIGLAFDEGDGQRLRFYQSKYPSQKLDEIEFHAGYLQLVDGPRIDLQIPDSAGDPLAPVVRELYPYPNLIDLRGRVVDHPTLFADQEDVSWNISLPYRAWLEDEHGSALETMPISMATLVEAEANQLRLGLEVQIPELPLVEESTVVVESLQVNVPFESLGVPRHPNPPPDFIQRSGSIHTVVWENRPFSVEELDHRLKQFWIWFQDPGGNLPSGTAITGTLALIISPPLSGLRRIRQFSPMGYPRPRTLLPAVSNLTTQSSRMAEAFLARGLRGSMEWGRSVAREFNRQLSQLAQSIEARREGEIVREHGTIVDRADMGNIGDYFEDIGDESADPFGEFLSELIARRPNAKQGFIYSDKTDVPLYAITRVNVNFRLEISHVVRNRRAIETAKLDLGKGILPDHSLIGDVVDNITYTGGMPRSEYHIREVIENSPRVSRLHSTLHKRLWNITGRRYYDETPFPIDFHVVITGNEFQGHPEQCDASAILTVQSVISNDDMEKRVLKTMDTLTSLIQEAAKQWRSTNGQTG